MRTTNQKTTDRGDGTASVIAMDFGTEFSGQISIDWAPESCVFLPVSAFRCDRRQEKRGSRAKGTKPQL